jgi:hypothetical protein
VASDDRAIVAAFLVYARHPACARRCYDCLVSPNDPDHLYAAIRTLPVSERLRLVERVVHDVAETAAVQQTPPSLLGLMADDPELVDRACAAALEARRKARLRITDE